MDEEALDVIDEGGVFAPDSLGEFLPQIVVGLLGFKGVQVNGFAAGGWRVGIVIRCVDIRFVFEEGIVLLLRAIEGRTRMSSSCVVVS